MKGRETAELLCVSCGVDTEHTLNYAGRLLVSTDCANCGAVYHHTEPHLKQAYLRDLELRIRTKPVRWLRRLRRNPVRTMLELPGAIATQPVKFAQEIVTVSRR